MFIFTNLTKNVNIIFSIYLFILFFYQSISECSSNALSVRGNIYESPFGNRGIWMHKIDNSVNPLGKIEIRGRSYIFSLLFDIYVPVL